MDREQVGQRLRRAIERHLTENPGGAMVVNPSGLAERMLDELGLAPPPELPPGKAEVTGPHSIRVRGRSMSSKWKCPACHHSWRVPIRTDRLLKRSCRCEPARVFVFGPRSGGGQHLSYTAFVRMEGSAT